MPMIIDGTNGGFFPSWTTATRPASPAVGQMGYNTTTGAFDAYTVAGWVSVASSATAPVNGPAFSAYRTGTQAYTSNTYTKIQLNTESFDTNNCYDSTTNYRFTPTVAGYYICTGQIQTAVGTYVETDIYKNGVSNGYSQIASAWGTPTTQLIYLNGSTDYIELYGFITTSGNINSSTSTYFQASMVRSA